MEDRLNEIITFLGDVGKLKSIKRFSASIKNSKETTAEHSWRLALMTSIVAKEFNLDLDIGKAVEIALVHDLAESVTGDVDAYNVSKGIVSKEGKDKQEISAMRQITAGISFGPAITKLWKEYLTKSSKEAKFVKALDKLEGFLSILEAGHEKYSKETFYSTYADEAVSNFPELSGLLDLIKQKLKVELSKGGIEWRE